MPRVFFAACHPLIACGVVQIGAQLQILLSVIVRPTSHIDGKRPPDHEFVTAKNAILDVLESNRPLPNKTPVRTRL